MFYAILKTLHLPSISVWSGGMTFVHFFLRAAMASFELGMRVRVMYAVPARFFSAIPADRHRGTCHWQLDDWQRGQTGYAVWRAFHDAGGVVDHGGAGPNHDGIFGYIRFALFVRLGRASSAADWLSAVAALVIFRFWTAVSLTLGVLIILVTLLGFSA